MGVVALLGIVTLFWATKLRRVNRELQAANQRLADISRHDALTGLYNRLHFNEVIDRTTGLCVRNNLVLTVAMIDLDHFKAINDSFGHAFGDACLRHVAALLDRFFRRETDTTIRYGGEEFLVIHVGGTTDAVVARLDAFRREVEQSVVTRDSVQSSLTLSIGVWSGVPGVGDSAAELLKLADDALYEAKNRGRNRLVRAGDATPV
jgi:polar amino acid transport system substrate-binding protein